MIFLENPRGGRKMSGRYKSGPKKGRIKPGYRLTKGGRVVKAGGKRRKRNAPTRSTRSSRGGSMRGKRRRRYRRNPPMPQMVRRLTDATVAAFQILAGKSAARAVPEALGLPRDGMQGLAAQAGVAVFAGVVASRFMGAKAAEYVTAGALIAPLEEVAVGLNIPFISGALQTQGINVVPAMESYPQLNAYPPAGYDVGQLEAYPSEYSQQY